MGIRTTIQPDREASKRLREAFKRLAKVGGNQRRVLGRIGLFVIREARRSLRQRRREWGPGSSRLSKSIAMQVDDMSVSVGSNLVYAAIQQLGGDVEPKRGKYLAIPVLPQLRRRGVWPRDLPEGSMKFVRAARIRIGSRSWTGPALVRADEAEQETSADGAGRRGQGGQRRRPARPAGEVMFALVKRVSIRGRPYLQFGEPAVNFALQQIAEEYARAVRGGP